MFDVRQIKISDRVVKYELTLEGKVFRYCDVIHLWQQSAEFTTVFSDLLAKSDMAAFRWETPSVTLENETRPFEFVLVDAGSFDNRPSNRRPFSKFFSSEPVVSFPSLGGDAQMIVPTSIIESDIYGHLAAFLRGAPDSQRVALWQSVGQEFRRLICDRPKWLSTAGGGVAWLHVRIDSRPKYYHYGPYRDTEYDQ